MATPLKLDEDSELDFTDCKVIEKREDGQLILHENNLNSFLQRVEKQLRGGSPLTLVTFLGSPSGGNAFFTNLLATHLESKGFSWASRVKKYGLKGFAFGENLQEGSIHGSVADKAAANKRCLSNENSEDDKTDLVRNSEQCIDNEKKDSIECRDNCEIKNRLPGAEYKTIVKNLLETDLQIDLIKRLGLKNAVAELVEAAKKVQNADYSSSDDDQREKDVKNSKRTSEHVVISIETDEPSDLENTVSLESNDENQKSGEMNKEANVVSLPNQLQHANDLTDSMETSDQCQSTINSKMNSRRQQSIRLPIKKCTCKQNKRSKKKLRPEQPPNIRRSARLLALENEDCKSMTLCKKKNEHKTGWGKKLNCFKSGKDIENYQNPEDVYMSKSDTSKKVKSTSSTKCDHHSPGSNEEDEEECLNTDCYLTSSTASSNEEEISQWTKSEDVQLHEQIQKANSQEQQQYYDKQNDFSSGLFHPDPSTSGIYFWPKFYKLNNHCDSKLLGILYAHHGKSESGQETGANSIDKLLMHICSVLVEVKWEETTAAAVRADICQNVIKIVKEDRSETSSTDSKDFNFFIDLKNGTNFVTLSNKQCQTVDKLVAAVTDEVTLKVQTFRGKDPQTLNASNLREFLEHNLARTNDNSFIGLPGRISQPQTPRSRGKPPVKDKPTPRKIRSKSKSPHCSSGEDSKSRSVTLNSDLPVKQTKHPIANLKALPSADFLEEQQQINLNYTEQTIDEITMKEIVNKQWNILQSELTSWIKTIDISQQINEIVDVYNKSLDNFYKNQLEALKSESPPDKAAVKAKHYKGQVDKILGKRVSNIQTGLSLFLEKAEKYMPERSAQNHARCQNNQAGLQKILKIVLEKIDQESVKIVEFGAMKAMEKYKMKQGDEQKICLNAIEKHKKEEIPLETCLEVIQIIRDCHRQFYNPENSSKQFVHPTTLFIGHQKIHSDLLQAHTEILGSVEGFPNQQNELKKHLIDDFFDFHTEILNKIGIMMKRVSRLIEKIGKEYENQMDALLKQNPYGLDETEFEAQHNRVVKKCEKTLTAAVHREMSKDEPIDYHIVALNKNIERTYKVLKSENKAAIGRREEPPLQHGKEGKAVTSNPLSSKDEGAIFKFNGNRFEKTSLNKTTPPVDLKTETKRRIILLQITLDKIGTASIQIGSEQTDPEEMNFYPAVVTLTKNDEWLLGNDAVNNSKSEKQTWWVNEYWHKCNSDEKILLNGQRLSINVEFLLSLIISAFVQKFEEDVSTEIVSEAFVAVPYWFTSIDRQKVLDAAEISGLTNVQLYNENSCSAFYMYAGKYHDPSYDTVVISENSQKVDISLYSYDSARGNLKLHGHCGDYDTEEACKGKQGRFLKFIYGIFTYLAGHQGEVGVEYEALKHLELLWQLTLKRAEAQTPGSKYRQRKVLLSLESDQWKELLWKLASKICDPELISCQTDIVLYGLASICNSLTFKNSSTILLSIADSTPFQTVCYDQHNNIVKATIKNIVFSKILESNNKVQKFEFPNEFGSNMFYRFFQENSGINIPVATLAVQCLPKSYTNVIVNLGFSQNGLVAVEDVQCNRQNYRWSSSEIHSLHSSYYSWETFRLTENDRLTYKSVLRQTKFHKPSILKRLTPGLEETLELGEKIKETIAQGMGSFKTNSGKENLLELIDSSLESLRQNNVPEYFVRQQKELFHEMSKTYKVQV